MNRGSGGTGSWIDSLSQGFDRYEKEGRSGSFNLANAKGRTVLVAKARWLLLLLVGAYALYAGVYFSLSEFGFFLSGLQTLFLCVSAVAVCSYNALYQFSYEKIRSIPYVDQLQIVFDLVFVTILIHFSGGSSSWFWPVYLIVTLEAAVLLERREDVWLLGALGGLCYGFVLLGEFFGLFQDVPMPFVDAALHHDANFLVLLWCWVSILNAAVAVIGAFLMAVIRRENRAARDSEARLREFLDTANDLIFSVTPEGEFLYTNRAWKKALGYDPAVDRDLRLSDIIDAEAQCRCMAAFNRVAQGENVGCIEGRYLSKDGRSIDVEGTISCSLSEERPVAVWGICRDITERKKAQEQLYHLAHHDMLTGLPNRLFFLDRLKQANALARRNKKQVAVLFLDLDRFKIINDTLGHSVGDELLQEAARRLAGCVREVDTVARLGGDEFTITLNSINGREDAEKIAQKVIKTLAAPMLLNGHEIFITTSIGVSLFPGDSEAPDGLVKKADIAMYHAKAKGRNNSQFYDPVMDADTDKRLKLENDLRRALDREEFRIDYQPKVDMKSGRVTAVEALLRWEHPELGLLPPGDFISLAEESGLICAVGEWVMHKACEQNVVWQRDGLPPVRVAVNLSGYQLQQPSLMETVSRVLEETGLEGRYLEFEITETVIMQNPEFAVAALNELRALGIHISIDDFGTGYSSLAHLKRFSVNTLKIDKTFVRDVEVSPTDAAITTAIIAMGNSLDLKVIAEGVETEGQFSFLKANLCDEVQGYLFSKPLPAAGIEEILRQGGKTLPLQVAGEQAQVAFPESP